MSHPTPSEIHSLYRSFIRLQRQWPRQEARPARLRDYILTRVRREFRQPDPTAAVAVRFANGQSELRHLRRIVEGNVEHEYALPESSPILTFLPAKKTFTLLDQEAQDELEGKGTVSYMKDYLASKMGVGR
ncbi:hypothetical protein HKX48_004879 [Thoreauomyces humboldtii]|nr:hypothetical protein HKX48_004879 [Thoreauomyces humboldtii]